MKKEHRISWGALFVEFIGIVFAVLLAFGINEWRAAQQDEALVEKAIQSILKEVQDNKQMLLGRNEYYAMLRDTTRFYMSLNGKDEVIKKPPPGFRGFNPPLLFNATYTVALETQAFAKMPFEKASAIGKVYELQEDFYNKGLDLSLERLLKEQDKMTYGSFFQTFNDLFIMGEELLGNYQWLEEALKK